MTIKEWEKTAIFGAVCERLGRRGRRLSVGAAKGLV